LGAGISKDAGIPLMRPLTDCVERLLVPEDRAVFSTIRDELNEYCHVEHVLSHLGDLISLAGRSKSGTATIAGIRKSQSELTQLHSKIRIAIRDTVRYGYRPGANGDPERIGTREQPIVTIGQHVEFVNALFKYRRAGLERRPPVDFFTTNYDTLLEDALAICRIRTADGFSGGTMAFWDPSSILDATSGADTGIQARMHKLHGSIDWYLSEEDIVVRRREGAGYPVEAAQTLLIYPQATKYQVTQKDPFASLFSAFRRALIRSGSGLVAVCGYSFGDDHINEMIERAMRQRGNSLTLLAFIHQKDDAVEQSTRGLPALFVKWLGEQTGDWRERIIIAGSRGVYHGSLANLLPAGDLQPHPWWSFSGLTHFLKNGPEEVQ
jgi:hypothetical protein